MWVHTGEQESISRLTEVGPRATSCGSSQNCPENNGDPYHAQNPTRLFLRIAVGSSVMTSIKRCPPPPFPPSAGSTNAAPGPSFALRLPLCTSSPLSKHHPPTRHPLSCVSRDLVDPRRSWPFPNCTHVFGDKLLVFVWDNFCSSKGSTLPPPRTHKTDPAYGCRNPLPDLEFNHQGKE